MKEESNAHQLPCRPACHPSHFAHICLDSSHLPCPSHARWHRRSIHATPIRIQKTGLKKNSKPNAEPGPSTYRGTPCSLYNYSHPSEGQTQPDPPNRPSKQSQTPRPASTIALTQSKSSTREWAQQQQQQPPHHRNSLSVLDLDHQPAEETEYLDWMTTTTSTTSRSAIHDDDDNLPRTSRTHRHGGDREFWTR